MGKYAKKEEEKAPPPPKKIYSELELQLFDKEMETLKYQKTLSSGEVVTLIDFQKYHQSKGSVTAAGAVLVFDDGFGEIKTPILYEVIEEKIRQWKNWKSRKEFGKKKRLEDLVSLSESMKIK